MQKNVEKGEAEYEIGEQMDLIDITPAELKKIMPIVKSYRKTVKQRVALTAKEKELKEEIKEYVHSSNMKRLPDGTIKFRCGDLIVELIPQDEKIKVKEETDAQAA